MTFNQARATLAVIGIFFIAFGMHGMYRAGRNAVIREAIEVGAAEYYLDDNYERQWRWKAPADLDP